MCTTIHLVLPADVDEREAIRALREFTSLSTEPVGKIDGDTLLAVTGTVGQCMCGTALGSAGASEEWDEAEHARDVARRRKRGWSESKIRRWSASKQSSHDRAERLAHERADGPSAVPVDDWLAFLRRALANRAVERVGVGVSHGDASWTAATPRQTLRIAGVTDSDLRELDENTLYVFVP